MKKEFDPTKQREILELTDEQLRQLDEQVFNPPKQQEIPEFTKEQLRRLDELFNPAKQQEIPEYTDEQLIRIHELEDAAQQLRIVVAESDDIPFDPVDIWTLIERAAELAEESGRRVRIPTRVTRPNGSQYITDYWNEDGAAETDHDQM